MNMAKDGLAELTEIRQYPHVKVTTYIGLGYREFLFNDGVIRTHQYTCQLDCHSHRQCVRDGNPVICFSPLVTVQDFPPEQEISEDDNSFYKSCVFCGNNKCSTCGDDFSNFI